MNAISNSARTFFALAIVVLTLGGSVCQTSAADEPVKAPQGNKKAGSAETKGPGAATSISSSNVLIFRNVRSWRRKTDFEEALTELGFKFDVKLSAEMEAADLSGYRFVIIPGAQWKDGYYHQYADNAPAFDRYVTNGGTLLLELNGAEGDGIVLPRGAAMVSHGSKDNSIILTNHPILEPLGGQPIHANYASHGFLEGVPKDALILATEMTDGHPDMNKPTFVEYRHGAGRVIAACQCFHDQDGSGRGILMETAINYAAERQWYSPKK